MEQRVIVLFLTLKDLKGLKDLKTQEIERELT
jgi:hypothetical protein